VAMLMLLVPAGEANVSVEPEVAWRLADLGVTHVSLMRDDALTAVVLEGWAFDPPVSGSEAAALLAPSLSGVRLLHLLAHMSLSAERATEGAPVPDAPLGGGLG